MDALIVAIQVMCVAGLAFGTVLSIFQMQTSRGKDLEFAAGNDFETGFRRMARNRP
jgi:hypothetical protein